MGEADEVFAVPVQQIEGVEENRRHRRPAVLQELEGRAPLLVERDDFAIDREVARQRRQRFGDRREAVVEPLLVSRKQRRPSSRSSPRRSGSRRT